jgi:hypothetical protein
MLTVLWIRHDLSGTIPGILSDPGRIQKIIPDPDPDPTFRAPIRIPQRHKFKHGTWLACNGGFIAIVNVDFVHVSKWKWLQ